MGKIREPKRGKIAFGAIPAAGSHSHSRHHRDLSLLPPRHKSTAIALLHPCLRTQNPIPSRQFPPKKAASRKRGRDGFDLPCIYLDEGGIKEEGVDE